MGTLVPGPLPTVGEAEDYCLDEAMANSAGFDGAVAVLTVGDRGAEAVSGHARCGGVVPCVADTLPANGRRAVLGGGTLFDTATYGPPDLASVAHELGHALDWSHANAGLFTVDNLDEWEDLNAAAPPDFQLTQAFLDDYRDDLVALLADPTATPKEIATLLRNVNGALAYGDLTDVMGASPVLRDDAGPRSIPQTMAFNRWASGWIDETEIATYTGGSSRVDVAPLGTAGTQMVVLPTDDVLEYYTLETRRASPFFPVDDHEGVIVHRIDQRAFFCGRTTVPCWGEAWNTQGVGGLPFEFGHVLSEGEVRDVGGVRVEVLSSNADGSYTVLVGEESPAELVAVPAAPAAPATNTAEPQTRAPSFTG